ncbi:RNA polymerase sigma factor SigJ [Actinopolyspora erythraea]|uniref:RNA polymerase sigma factor SigJ n=1 Tax=Actinopolyspora erythraea TaxID=414996 RepID=A0A099D1Q0_9ACTN|nr:sigma factor-like helix-turn-helix DNA-binding protein [Actinopolyspora erythraea]ASU80885.1 RNA polymerase sigma factor SigJ [Actinopolyspora erythraea]KGI79747.1 RNA polymerase sigma factor SigJ [Actinopolyspora erythraea]
MRSAEEALAAEFDSPRARLLGLVYRLTGSITESEEVVRRTRQRSAEPRDHAGPSGSDPDEWLCGPPGRLSIERALAGAAHREHYVGPWLPEPIVTWQANTRPLDPLETLGRAEDVRMAALRVLQQLTPEQRIALVMHENFEVPFDRIAGMLGCTVTAAGQYASRARRAMNEARPPHRVPAAEQHELIETLLTALAAGDQWRLARLLHPHVSVHGDSDGKARTALRPVHGRDKVTRFLLSMMRKYPSATLLNLRSVLVNGDPGLLLPGIRGGGSSQGGVSARVIGFAVRDGCVAEIHDIVNPDKLTRVSSPHGGA